MTPLILALLQQVIVPELMVAVRAHWNATGNLPTDAQILAALTLNADRVVAIGESWLASHPAP